MATRVVCGAFAGLVLCSVAALNAATVQQNISTCAINNSGPAFTCNVFETDAEGHPSDISNEFELPAAVSAGYIVLLEDALSNETDRTSWSDVLVFGTGFGFATTAQLFSKGCNVAPGDISCFPLYETVTLAPHLFVVEDPAGITVVSSPPNTFLIHDNPQNEPGVIPEPATVVLCGASLVFLGLFSLRRPVAKARQ